MSDAARKVDRSAAKCEENQIIPCCPIWVALKDADEHSFRLLRLAYFHRIRPVVVHRTNKYLRVTPFVAEGRWESELLFAPVTIDNLDANTSSVHVKLGPDSLEGLLKFPQPRMDLLNVVPDGAEEPIRNYQQREESYRYPSFRAYESR